MIDIERRKPENIEWVLIFFKTEFLMGEKNGIQGEKPEISHASGHMVHITSVRSECLVVTQCTPKQCRNIVHT